MASVPGATRAESEIPAPTKKPRGSTRPKPDSNGRIIYVLDYEKRFPGTKPNWPRRGGLTPFYGNPTEMRPFAAENPRLNAKKFVCEARFGYSFGRALCLTKLNPPR